MFEWVYKLFAAARPATGTKPPIAISFLVFEVSDGRGRNGLAFVSPSRMKMWVAWQAVDRIGGWYAANPN